MLTRLATNRGWIGIDAGSCALKVAQVERVGAALRLVDAVIVPRQSPGKFGNSLAGEIRAALSLSGTFSGQRAALAMPIQACQIHEMSLAAMTPADQHRAIREELTATDGAASHDCQFDFWSLDDDPHASPARVNIITTAASAARSLAGDVRRAGLQCQVLDAVPTTVARAIGIGQSGLDDVVAALDWGYSGATFTIVQEGRPRFTRNLRECGFGGILEAAKEYLGLPGEEAALLFRDEGLPDPSAIGAAAPPLQRALAELASEALERLIGELERTLTYLDVHRRRLRPASMILLGGGALFKNITAVLAHHTGLPARVWSAPQFLPAASGTSLPVPLLSQAIALSLLRWEVP